MKIPIGYKIFSGFFILIVLSASFLLYSLPSLTLINELSSEVVPMSKEMKLLQNFSEKIKRLENKVELYLSIRSEETKENALGAVRDINQFVAKVSKEEDAPKLKKVLDLNLNLTGAVYTLFGFMENRESTYKSNVQVININNLLEELDKVIKVFQNERLVGMQKNVNLQKQIIDELLNKFFVIEISIIVIGFLSSFILVRLITHNILKLDKATQEIASGNFSTRIKLKSNDELGQLGDSFNTMAQDLEKTTVSKEYVDSIIDSMLETLMVTGPELTIKHANKAVCKLLGFSEDELIGQPLDKILASCDSDEDHRQWEEAIKKGEFINREICYLSKSGLRIPVLFSASQIKDDSGGIRYIICTAGDITERKVAEEKIKEIAGIKSKLISMVSHELRTPMAAIKTGISIVLDGLAGEINEEQADILDTLRRNVNRLARLINDVLDFQKLEAGKTEFKISGNDINEVVSECCQSMRQVAKDKGLVLKLELAKDLSKMPFDRDKIIQVVSNLLSNAIKFTLKGSITLATQIEPEGKIKVMVKDPGMGIKDEDIHRVFSSFEQISRPAGGQEAGSGLGLTICKEIIQKHNGHIWVESEYNVGSTFAFTLPC